MKKIVFILCLLVGAFQAIAQSTDQSYNVRRALEALQQGNTDGALNALVQEVQQNPRNGVAYFYLAAICEHMEKPIPTMRFAYDAVKNLSKGQVKMIAESYHMLADIYLQGQDTTMALQLLDKALIADKANVDIYALRANVLDEQKQYEQMLIEGKALIKKAPKEVTGYVIAAEALRHQKHYTEAIDMLDKAEKTLEPGEKYMSRIHMMRAQNLMGMKQYLEAMDEAAASIKIRVNNPSLRLLSGMSDSLDVQTVMERFDQYIEQDPTNEWWWLLKGDNYSRQRQYAEEIICYLKGNKINEMPFLYESIGEGLRHYVGDMELAEKYYRIGMEKDSTNAQYPMLMADYYHDLGQYEEALVWADKAIGMNANKPNFFYARGRIYRDMHDYEKAIENFYMGLVADPENTDYYFSIASMYKQMGDTAKMQEAIEQGKKAVELAGDSLSAEQWIVAGDWDKAYEMAGSMVKKENSNTQHYNAACVYALTGHTEEAMLHLEKSLEYGMRNFHHIAWDEDLDNLRQLPEFETLVNRYKEINLGEIAALRARIEEIEK